MTTKDNDTLDRASIGILMLDTDFDRILGDIGNICTWPFTVKYKVVSGAKVEGVINKQSAGLLEPFIEAGRELVSEGVKALTTSCGFLSLLQQPLASAFSVPFASSSLMQVNMIQATLPKNKKVGVITVSKEMLTPQHFNAVNAPSDLPLIGMPLESDFSQVFLSGKKQSFSKSKVEAELLASAKLLIKSHPDVGAIVLECTNMTPYAAAISEAVSLPVYSIYTLVSWLHSAIAPRSFGK